MSVKFLAGVMTGLLVVAVGAGCDRSADGTDQMGGDTGAPGAQAGDMGGMPTESGMMQRHAAELDSMITTVRTHVRQMRALPPAQWHARMSEHAPVTAGMISMVERQVREMDMGMGMSDMDMGAMMGMTGPEHRNMINEIEALRNEIGQLQTAPRSEVEARMPAHLGRLERMLERLEKSAVHMRGG